MMRLSSMMAGILVSLPVLSLEPRAVDMEGIEITPSVTLEYRMDDNLYATEDDEVEAGVFLVRPEVSLQRNVDNQRYAMELSLDSGRYDGDDEGVQEDDFLDWRVAGIAEFTMPDGIVISLDGDIESTHEYRGTDFSEGGRLPPEPDRFDDHSAGLMLGKALDLNVGWLTIERAEVGGDYFNREYTTRRLITSSRDRAESGLSAALYFSLLPGIGFSTEYRQVGIDYHFDPIFSALDSDEQYFQLGANWQAILGTSGRLKAGKGRKEFLSPERTDAAESVWELEVSHQLDERTTLNFASSRGLEETKGAGSFFVDSHYSVDWQHQWSGRTRATVGLEYVDDSFTDSARDDDTLILNAGLTFRPVRWLDLYARLSLQDRDSTISSYRFQKNLLVIGIQASL